MEKAKRLIKGLQSEQAKTQRSALDHVKQLHTHHIDAQMYNTHAHPTPTHTQGHTHSATHTRMCLTCTHHSLTQAPLSVYPPARSRALSRPVPSSRACFPRLLPFCSTQSKPNTPHHVDPHHQHQILKAAMYNRLEELKEIVISDPRSVLAKEVYMYTYLRILLYGLCS